MMFRIKTFCSHGRSIIFGWVDRKSTRLNSSHGYISYAVVGLKKKRIAGPRVAHVDDDVTGDPLHVARRPQPPALRRVADGRGLAPRPVAGEGLVRRRGPAPLE